MQSRVRPDLIKLHRMDRLPEGVLCLVIQNPRPDGSDYEEFQGSPRALEFEGRLCGRTGYDSDQGLTYYRSDTRVVLVRGPAHHRCSNSTGVTQPGDEWIRLR